MRRLVIYVLLIGLVSAIGYTIEAQESSLKDLINCTGSGANHPLCVEKRNAADLRAGYESKFQPLSAVQSPPWPEDQMFKAQELAKQARNYEEDRYFGDAVPLLAQAIKILNSLELQLDEATNSGLTEIDQLTSEKRYEEALNVLKRVSLWTSDAEMVAQKEMEIEELRQLGALLDEVDLKISGGQNDDALSQLRTVSQSLRNERWRDLNERIEGPRREARFQGFVSNAIKFRDQTEYAKALTETTKALKIKPNDVFIKELEEDIQLQQTRFELKALEEQLRLYQSQEDWVNSEKILHQLLPQSGDEIGTAELLALVQVRIEIEDLADRLLLHQDSGLSRKSLRDIQDLLNQSVGLDVGQRISTKLSELRTLRELWSTPVIVTIHSDNKTEVLIRPGRSLGTFETRRIEINPGVYRFSGIRRGYREHVEELSIAPRSTGLEITVICNEQF